MFDGDYEAIWYNDYIYVEEDSLLDVAVWNSWFSVGCEEIRVFITNYSSWYDIDQEQRRFCSLWLETCLKMDRHQACAFLRSNTNRLVFSRSKLVAVELSLSASISVEKLRRCFEVKLWSEKLKPKLLQRRTWNGNFREPPAICFFFGWYFVVIFYLLSCYISLVEDAATCLIVLVIFGLISELFFSTWVNELSAIPLVV